MNRLHLSQFSKTLDASLANLANTGRGKKQAVSITVDAFMSASALWLAYSLRHGAVFTDFKNTWHIYLLLPLFTVTVFSALGIYRWVVRSSNNRLFRNIIKGVIASTLILMALMVLLPPDAVLPRSLFAIYGMLLTIGTCGSRFVWTILFDSGNRGEPIAIFGAGDAGQRLTNLLSQGNEYRPVIVLDDNPSLASSTVSGVPVFDARSADIEQQMKRREVSRIVLAIPSADSETYRDRLSQLEHFGLPIQTVPSVSEMIGTGAKVNEIRDISIRDILGRREVPPNRKLLGACVRGKVVMVSGGGGSIGSELCRQILAQDPKKLIVVDNSEENLYHIIEEYNKLADPLAATEFVPLLSSVTDSQAINRTISEHKVETIYHAAAYKHVPIIELQPEQGVRVNIFGTLTLLDAAIAHSVGTFVLISSDKAVRPANAMGASKRVAEMILQARAKQSHNTRVCMVRFGNVLGSSGSVVPKFKKQILDGGPITVTHPDITRYFMTIPEAAQLVLQASAIAEGGEVFALDMGEPVKIVDLATTMVRLYGKKLQSETSNPNDIAIQIDGLRPGEKMYEELFIDDTHRRTTVPKVFSAEENWMPWNHLQTELSALRDLANTADCAETTDKLMDIAYYGQAELRAERTKRKSHRHPSLATLKSPQISRVDVSSGATEDAGEAVVEKTVEAVT